MVLKSLINLAVSLLLLSIVFTSFMFAVTIVEFIQNNSGDIQQAKSGLELNVPIQDNWVFKRAISVGPERYWSFVRSKHILGVYNCFTLLSIAFLVSLLSIIQSLRNINNNLH